jgi:phosphate transport system protein
MELRSQYHRELDALRDDILKMGSKVDEELMLALDALDNLDTKLADHVYVLDRVVNAERFTIEDRCVWLIATQQPAARDLRAIVAVMSMAVDLERMGDQAKGIAKFIPHLVRYPAIPKPSQLAEMGASASVMLREVMKAYATDDIPLAQEVAQMDQEVDALYTQVFTQIMQHMAEVEEADRAEALYEVIRAARELERFCDLATNIAERVVFLMTGKMRESGLP